MAQFVTAVYNDRLFLEALHYFSVHNVKLAVEPGFAPLHDVGAALLRGLGGLFFRVMLRRSKTLFWVSPK